MGDFVQTIKNRLIALLVIAVVLCAGGGWWYFNYHIKTPEYSVRMIQEAVSAHDKSKFYEYVDVNHLLDTSSDAMLDGLVHAMIPAADETKDAVSSLTKMFKAPVVMSLQKAVDNYIEQGTWLDKNVTGDSAEASVDADMIVSRIGLSDISFQRLDSMSIDDEKSVALAKVRVLQNGTNEEYVLDVELVENEDGVWQVYEITNFKEFIAEMQLQRQKEVKTYLDESASLMQQHDAVISEAEQLLADVRQGGTLGSDEIRQQIKSILNEKVIPDWEARKAELEAMNVPEAAGSLHRLRIKICDARIEAVKNYAQWMDDKKAATVRVADNSLKMAKTLEKEAELLTKQVNAHVK